MKVFDLIQIWFLILAVWSVLGCIKLALDAGLHIYLRKKP